MFGLIERVRYASVCRKAKENMKTVHSNSPRVLSLFSGGGGLDVGFHQSGFDIVGCLEIDAASCLTLENNKGNFISDNCVVFNNDITKTDPSTLNIEPVDFIIGGPPCQSFSAAGRRAGGVPGINDTRGSLFWDYCQYVKHFKPKGFLFENVRGILQANHAKDWETIKASFSELGYSLYFRILDAADFGTPQHRERVIMVGIRNDTDVHFRFPAPTHGPHSVSKKPYVTSLEALADLCDPNEAEVSYGGKYGHLLPNIPPGQNYSFYTEELGHTQPLFAWRSKFSGFLYKLDPNGLSKTIVAQQGRYDGPFHWKNRKLTVGELKRIQGFPDQYEFLGSKVDVIKQIGNSVAPKMAYNLGLAVYNQLFGAKHEMSYVNAEDVTTLDKRKSVKAKTTRKRTSKIKLTPEQSSLHFFENPIETRNISDQISIKSGALVSRSMELKNGVWIIGLSACGKKKKPIVKLVLDFDRLINGSFYRIEASSSLSEFEQISFLWDAVHRAVSEASSYSDLTPLYGHFTEPYPKFRLSVELPPNGDSMFSFLSKICDFEFLSKLHPLKELEEMSLDNDPVETARHLRGIGFDVRVNETNRTIPAGFFRICYPFTLPKNSKTYTVWTEKGEHKHSDLEFEAKKRAAG